MMSSNLASTSSTGRGLASLLIMVHLFFVAAAMVASYGRSELTGRLLTRFAFYTQLLNIDLNLNYASYQLTHASESDVDHRLEVLPKGGEPGQSSDWTILTAGRFRGGERYKRYQRLAKYLGLLAGDDAHSARLARSVAQHFLIARKIQPAQIRARRHLLQDWDVATSGTEGERDPNSEVYFRVPYAANCVVLSETRVDVIKVEEPDKVALPRS